MQSKKQLLIIYSGHSPVGSTATIAKWIGGNKKDKTTGAVKYVNVIIKAVSDTTSGDVNNADGIVLGSDIYNGNPKQDIIDFVNKLNVGNRETVLDGKICGVFCTSTGYETGTRHFLNGLSKLAMTHGAIFVGGLGYETSQGVYGMVDDKSDGTWEWDPGMENLQYDAESYGERLGMITSFFHESYTNKLGSSEVSTSQVIICGKCNSTPKKYKDDHICWLLVPATLLATVLFIILVMKKQ